MTQKIVLRILLVAALGLGSGLAIGACGDDDAGDSSGQRIDLIVTDTGLDPSEIQASAGELRLEVTNDGANPHALVITGDAGEVDRFNEDIEPGESRTLRVTLDPGTYRIADTRDPNITGTITVEGGTDTVTQTETQTEVERETETVEPPTETVEPPTETVEPPTETETVTVPEDTETEEPTTP